MLNWALIKSPLNWITVFLMVFIGIMALNFLLAPWHLQPLNNGELSANSEPGPLLATMQ